MLSLFRFGAEHHRVILEDAMPRFNSWLGTLTPILKEEVELAIANGLAQESLEPASLAITVNDVAHSDWTISEPELCLRDAVQLLSMPFKIVLENERSDKAFILRMLTPEQSQWIEKLENSRVLEFDGKGGIGEVISFLRSPEVSRAQARYLYWVLTDSDALSPGSPSGNAKLVEDLRHNLQIEGYQLKRRAIENYLPFDTLRTWMLERQRDRRDIFESFRKLSNDQRSHYNMKRGLEADEPRNDPDHITLFAHLSGRDRTMLGVGFGTNIGENFRDPNRVREQYIAREGVRNELTPALNRLIEMVR
jgi:hypothetical protein